MRSIYGALSRCGESGNDEVSERSRHSELSQTLYWNKMKIGREEKRKRITIA